MLVSLPLIFLVLAVHLSASSSDAEPSASKVSRPTKTTVISGKLLYAHSLLPAEDEFYSENRSSSACRQAVLKRGTWPFADPAFG